MNDSHASTDSGTETSEQQWDLYDLEMLDRIQKRVLWLSTYMVHYANFVRPNPDGMKVGGHEASSASVVTFLGPVFLFPAFR